MPVNSRAGQQTEDDELCTHLFVEPIDQHIDPDVDAGAHAIGRTELGHPHEHDDGEFLRPGEIEGQQPVLHDGNAQRRRRSDGRRTTKMISVAPAMRKVINHSSR